MTGASIRRRFAISVGANLARAGLNFLAAMLLARWLGPADYGRMAFLLGTFAAVRSLLDMGTSSAFFTFLSQQHRSRRFVAWFFAWQALQFLVPLAVIGFIFPADWIAGIWQDEPRELVLLAFIAVFMQQGLWQVALQAGESQRDTVYVQVLGVGVAGLHLLLVAMLWVAGLLTLHTLFALVAVEYLLVSIAVRRRFFYTTTKGGDDLRTVWHKFAGYCGPLVFYAWAGFCYEFADRWLLQSYGGGIEQSYYAVGAQFAMVALLATSSVLRIFWKEVAEAHHRGDYARAGDIYRKMSRLLFLVGATIAGFLIPWTAELVQLLLGNAYAGGATTVALMFLFPVHQSMGQIGSTMLMATEQLALYARIGVAFMLASVVVAYFVLAPPDAMPPGLGWGAEGLALKMVVMQVIQVNVIAYLIARLWNWDFDWLYQPVALASCLCFGWLAHAAVAGWPVATGLCAAGFLHLALISAFVYSNPWLVGMTREELCAAMHRR